MATGFRQLGKTRSGDAGARGSRSLDRAGAQGADAERPSLPVPEWRHPPHTTDAVKAAYERQRARGDIPRHRRRGISPAVGRAAGQISFDRLPRDRPQRGPGPLPSRLGRCSRRPARAPPQAGQTRSTACFKGSGGSQARPVLVSRADLQDGCDGSFLVTPPCRSRTKRSAYRSTTLAGARRSSAPSPSGCGQPGPCAVRRSPAGPPGGASSAAWCPSPSPHYRLS